MLSALSINNKQYDLMDFLEQQIGAFYLLGLMVKDADFV